MKLLLIVLIVCVYWNSVSAWGVHKTRGNKTAKVTRPHDVVPPRPVTAHPIHPPHHPKSTTRRAPGARRNRVVHPRFRHLVKSTTKKPTMTSTRKSIVKQIHRKVKTKSAVLHSKLLARNVRSQTTLSDLDSHYKEQIRGFFQQQQQHHHGPVQTRSRVKTGLK